MKTIVAGSRGIGVDALGKQSSDTLPVQWCVKQSGFEVTTVISGTARGVDKLGEFWAEENGVNIWRFPADWNQYGKRAGYMRNQDMADVADALIAIWNGESRGTKHMIDIALKANLKVFIYNTKTKTKVWYNELYEG